MDFDWNVIDDPTNKQLAIDIPELTDAFLEEGGVVLVFLKAFYTNGSAELMVQLPYIQGNDVLTSIAAVLAPGTLTSTDLERGLILMISSLDGTTPVSDMQDDPSPTGSNYDFR